LATSFGAELEELSRQAHVFLFQTFWMEETFRFRGNQMVLVIEEVVLPLGRAIALLAYAGLASSSSLSKWECMIRALMTP
jgi:hypothetical protein